MPWPRKDPQDVGKMRSARLSDKVYNYVVARYGSLAELARYVYEAETPTTPPLANSKRKVDDIR